MDSSTADDASSNADTVATKPAKDVPVVVDEGFFTHFTGDTYNGCFEATKKTRTIKMHGKGVYITAEGDVYTGIWENDKFGAYEDVSIEFVDGSAYAGPIKDWCFTGNGKYIFPDESVLTADFVENCPHGTMKLLDPNGHTWVGKADVGFGWVDPVNHFYTLLEKRESTKIKRRRKSFE